MRVQRSACLAPGGLDGLEVGFDLVAQRLEILRAGGVAAECYMLRHAVLGGVLQQLPERRDVLQARQLAAGGRDALVLGQHE